jgi:hypothetical protein
LKSFEAFPSDPLLIFNVLLDEREGSAADRRHKITVRP